MGPGTEVRCVPENLGCADVRFRDPRGSQAPPFPSLLCPQCLSFLLSAAAFSPLSLGLGQALVLQFSSIHIKIYQCLPPNLFFFLFKGKKHPYRFPGLTFSCGLLLPCPPGPVDCSSFISSPCPFAPSASLFPLLTVFFLISLGSITKY